ncbi:Trehalose/maltose import ATP-binding protein MalK [uncultured archaeon]|nr:Trehalose/maltose import ATP-binding protein MalK [uncultured archaeon]
MQMPHIQIRNVSKYYGSVKALHNVDLDIEDGEYVVLLGPSGCGKTTLLKIVAGTVEPSSGHVSLAGRDLTRLPPEDRGIGFVFQNYALFPHLSALENASYGRLARGEAPEKAHRIGQEMLKLVHLAERADAIPKELSGGMQQRLAIARALATGSKLLLLDEPTNALDAHIRTELREELRRMAKQLGLTVVHVTHDQEEAMALADKIVIMRQGKILQAGTPKEVYEHPATPFVANFLGEANFLRVTFEDDRAQLLGRPVEARLRGPHIACIRPESLRLDDKGAKIRILGSRAFGPFYKYDVDYNGLSLRVRATHDKSDATHVSFDPADVLYFSEPDEGLEKALSAV